MPLSVLFFAIAAAAQSPAPAAAPIIVRGNVWAPFISPMGEPFRSHPWGNDPLADWFRQADVNHDGLLVPGEMQADSARFFNLLDTDLDGEIEPDELIRYEWEVAPEIQLMSRTRRERGEPAEKKSRRGRDGRDGSGGSGRWGPGRSDDGWNEGPQGAARYALLDIPQPVAAADADFNRAISLSEFAAAAIARFNLLDRSRRGSLDLAQLQAMRFASAAAKRRHKRGKDDPDKRFGSPMPPGG